MVVSEPNFDKINKRLIDNTVCLSQKTGEFMDYQCLAQGFKPLRRATQSLAVSLPAVKMNF